MIFLNDSFEGLTQEELMGCLVIEIGKSTWWAKLFYQLRKIDREEIGIFNDI